MDNINIIAEIYDKWYSTRTEAEKMVLDGCLKDIQGSIKNAGDMTSKVILVYALLYKDRPWVKIAKSGINSREER